MRRESLVGSTVGGYLLEERVGAGGTADVFRATHSQHGTVALKILRRRLRADPVAVRRFLREARYGERVVHPNVVRTIERGEDGPLHFLALEWASGELLEAYARRAGPMRVANVVDIVFEIAVAAQATHDAGIVHRDLKPDNVMFEMATRTIKLLDFGIATAVNVSPDERLTHEGHFVGTLLYLPPEALDGRMVTAAADQYSVAAIAYFLLSGCLPYTARTPRAMLRQLTTEPPVPLNAAREGLRFSDEMECVVMRALAKEPAKRYASVMEFATAFRRCVSAAA
ncbi:MAG: serine/threonine-protein kinase [Gemmatimonadaceae bacterium]